MASLLEAVSDSGADILTSALVTKLYCDENSQVRGVEFDRPDGSVEKIGCSTLILATCGFAANRKLVSRHIPELSSIISHTHPGAQGDALGWGNELGAATGDLDAYQGHSNIAAGHGLLISWLAITEGGIQVNSRGERFSDESRGYSEQAVDVAAQPGGSVWTIYDGRIDAAMSEIAEYRDVCGAGAVIEAKSVEQLANRIGVPFETLDATMSLVARLARDGNADAFGRRFAPEHTLSAPYKLAKVEPALFHTQGGLVVNNEARVLREGGAPFPNLFAGGGAARGISGSGAAGYVAGNGLMTATTLGRLAGAAAARQALSSNSSS